VIQATREGANLFDETGIDASLEAESYLASFAIEPAVGHHMRIVRWDDALDGLRDGTFQRFITSKPMSRWLSQQADIARFEEFGSATELPKSEWVFGIRESAAGLREALNEFIESQQGSLIWNVIRNRYLRSGKDLKKLSSSELYTRSKIPFESDFRKIAGEFGLDWRLIAAQASVESGFNPEAVSWVGARGILQVMPATADELGVVHLHRVENGLQAGMHYLSWLMKRFESTLPYRQRLRFALAAYNIGLGHVRDARKLAARLDLDPDRWFGNVEQAMLKLREPRYYQKARYGYCRGGEVVAYVSKVQTLYDVYVQSFTP
jgi:membrane-bound lytic murein transglycosylase F